MLHMAAWKVIMLLNIRYILSCDEEFEKSGAYFHLFEKDFKQSAGSIRLTKTILTASYRDRLW